MEIGCALSSSFGLSSVLELPPAIGDFFEGLAPGSPFESLRATADAAVGTTARGADASGEESTAVRETSDRLEVDSVSVPRPDFPLDETIG
jgi:hypothetical protein